MCPRWVFTHRPQARDSLKQNCAEMKHSSRLGVNQPLAAQTIIFKKAEAVALAQNVDWQLSQRLFIRRSTEPPQSPWESSINADKPEGAWLRRGCALPAGPGCHLKPQEFLQVLQAEGWAPGHSAPECCRPAGPSQCSQHTWRLGEWPGAEERAAGLECSVGPEWLCMATVYVPQASGALEPHRVLLCLPPPRQGHCGRNCWRRASPGQGGGLIASASSPELYVQLELEEQEGCAD